MTQIHYNVEYSSIKQLSYSIHIHILYIIMAFTEPYLDLTHDSAWTFKAIKDMRYCPGKCNVMYVFASLIKCLQLKLKDKYLIYFIL